MKNQYLIKPGTMNRYVYLTLIMASTVCLATFSIQTAKAKKSEYEISCVAAFKTSDFNLAKQICVKQLTLAQNKNDKIGILALYIAIADVYKHLGENKKFEHYLKLAEEHPLFDSTPEKKHQWLRLKAIKLHHTEKFEQSNQLFSEALEIALQLNDEKKISDSNIDLGISAAARGDYKTSFNHYRTSLEFIRKINDQYATGLALQSVGRVYIKLEEYGAAVNYFMDALSQYDEYTSKNFYDHRVHDSIANVYKEIMFAHQALNQHNEAQLYQQKLENFTASLSNDHDRANELVQQAKMLIELKNYDQAAPKLLTALKLYQKEGIENPLEVYYMLANAYHKLQQNDLALNYALIGIESVKTDSNYQQTIGQIYDLLSQIYAKSNPTIALHYAHKYNNSREQFLSAKYNSDLKTIQHQIELEKNQNKLVSSQLENMTQKNKIQALNNKYLLSLLLLLCLVVLIIYLYVKNKRKQTALIDSINYHKNQLTVFSLDAQPKENISEDNRLKQAQQKQMNEQLVQMMHEATNLWIKHTGENLIELADRSKIWTITNDNGTLRARSLEKYHSLQKIPHNPRWRNVVRTCHFVLSEPKIDQGQRQQLNLKLEKLMQVIKEFYGTGK